jgi:hypothetical protein
MSNTIKVFILSGQSNMVGYGKTAELPRHFRTLPRNVTLKNHCPQGFFARRRKFGPEIGFAHTLAAAWPDESILLVKYAVNATSLLAWSPDWSYERARQTGNADAGPLYETLFRYVNAAIRDKQVEFAGVLWMQGERDALYPAIAQDYARNFTHLIARFRADTSKPDLPVIFGKIAPPDAWAGRETVWQAQEAVNQTVPWTRCISTDDLIKAGGELHYATEGQLTLGRRFAEAYLDMITSEATRSARSARD